MTNRDGTKHDVTGAQEAMLRIAKRDHGLSSERIALETGIPLATVKSWKRTQATVVMSLSDFVAVARIIPNELLSLIIEPAGKHIASNGDGHSDLDALALEAAEFAHEYSLARHPNGPGGVTIVPQEASKLHDIRRRMLAKAVAA
jgi:hypothetical protein